MAGRELLVLEIENDEPGPASFLWLFLFFVLHVPLVFKETVECGVDISLARRLFFLPVWLALFLLLWSTWRENPDG